MSMPDDREEQEREEGYHKVDRRIGHREDDQAEAAPAPEEPMEEPVSEAPEDEADFADDASAAAAEAAMQIDMYAILRMVYGMSVEQAWVHLGLQLAPGAKETKADLRQARLAIDTVAYIKDALGDNLQDAEKREVEQALATLRMNYLQRT
jgi:hypothetical protein